MLSYPFVSNASSRTTLRQQYHEPYLIRLMLSRFSTVHSATATLSRNFYSQSAVTRMFYTCTTYSSTFPRQVFCAYTKIARIASFLLLRWHTYCFHSLFAFHLSLLLGCDLKKKKKRYLIHEKWRHRETASFYCLPTWSDLKIARGSPSSPLSRLLSYFYPISPPS